MYLTPAMDMDRTVSRLIVPDCLTFYLLSIYPMKDFDTRPQLDRDLHMG